MFVLDARKVADAMRARGIRSIAALAARVGMHRNSLSRFMSGREAVLPDSVTRVLEELDLSPADAIVRQEAAGNETTEPVADLVDSLVLACPRAAYVLFGSRARRKGKRYSDFDLGVYSREGIALPTYLQLLEIKELAEEDSPYFFDLVNLNNADSDFLRSIAPDLVLLGGRHGDWLALIDRCSA